MTSDFASKVAKYPKSSPNLQVPQNGDLGNDVRYARNFVTFMGKRDAKQEYDVRFCIGGS